MSQSIIFPIFNSKDFAQPTYINALITDSLQSSNISSASLKVVSNASGAEVDVATEEYVDTAITNLQTALLGTDVSSQLNQSLDTILEIDGAITDLQTSISAKANQSDLDTTNTNVSSNTSGINTINGQITTINSTLGNKANQSDLTSTNTRVTSLEGKTNAISYNNVTNTTTINSKVVVNLDDQLNGNTTIGDSSTDTLTVNANTVFNGTVTGLTKSTVGLSNIDNTSDVNKPLSTAQKTYVDNGLSSKANQSSLDTTNTNVTNLTNSKADKSSSLYTNSWYVNSGVNTITSVLSSIGTSQNQTIYLTSGGITESSGLTLSKINLIMQGPDSAFASPATVIYGATTLSGSTTLRTRISNVQFNDSFTINGTLGKHTFKGVVFNNGFTLQGSTTDFINCYYCSFSGTITIPNTFAGYIIFYFCDFAGCTLTLNNVSNQQVYFNSCVNLPSLSLNGLLNGFNTTSTTSAINSVSLNVSGTTSFPSNSINSSSINNTSFVDLSNTQTVSGTKTINNLISSTKSQGNNSTSVATTAYVDTGLATKQATLTFDSTPTTSSTNVVNSGNIKSYVDTGLATKQATLTFDSTPTTSSTNVVNSGNIKSYVDTAVSNLVSSAPSTLDTLNELATALGNDPNYATTTATLIGTKASQTSLNTTNANVTTNANNIATNTSNIATNTSNIATNTSSINSLTTRVGTTETNITSLQSGKQNTLTFDSTPTSSSTNPVTSGGVYTSLQNYQPTSGMSSYLTTSSASSTYQTQSGMSSYLTTTNAGTTYAGLSSNNTMSGNNTFSGNNTITVAEVYEQINSVSSVTTSLSLNYSTCKGINYIQTPTSNFSLALTNIPTSSTNASYSIVLMIPSKFYCNSCTVNGTSRTINFAGGSANVSINASAVYVLQQISVMFLNSSTPVVTSSVISMY